MIDFDLKFYACLGGFAAPSPFGLISGAVIILKTIYDFLIGDPNIILFASSC